MYHFFEDEDLISCFPFSPFKQTVLLNYSIPYLETVILSVVLFAVYLIYLTVQTLPTFFLPIQSSALED